MVMSLPKVIIRAMEPEDLDMLYQIENNNKLWGVGTTNVPYSRYALHDYIANASSDIYTDKQVRFMIDNEQGETLGIADVVNFDPQHLRAEIGIVIVNQYRGRGYAAATLSLLKEYAKVVLHLHQIYAVVDENNQDSIRLFDRAGFSSTAELKDWLFDGEEYHGAIMMQTFL
jgi:diamine N-acetyltransferase